MNIQYTASVLFALQRKQPGAHVSRDTRRFACQDAQSSRSQRTQIHTHVDENTKPRGSKNLLTTEPVRTTHRVGHKKWERLKTGQSRKLSGWTAVPHRHAPSPSTSRRTPETSETIRESAESMQHTKDIVYRRDSKCNPRARWGSDLSVVYTLNVHPIKTGIFSKLYSSKTTQCHIAAQIPKLLTLWKQSNVSMVKATCRKLRQGLSEL